MRGRSANIHECACVCMLSDFEAKIKTVKWRRKSQWVGT